MTRADQLRALNAYRWQDGENRCADALELLASGESSDRIARRLGTTKTALARLLARHGYSSAGFNRTYREQRSA